ncbi:Variant-specific surface protein, partial [Giardia duodenalis]
VHCVHGTLVDALRCCTSRTLRCSGMHGVTEVEGLCGAMGVLEGVGGGLWGGELQHTGEATACSACQDGYYKAGNVCTPCTDTCATCTAADTCTSCPEGKYLNGNQCVAKGSCGADKYEDDDSMTCAACSTLNGCTACALGDTGKPQCSACGASNKLKVELDGTITCVAEAQCATNGQEGTHFMDKANSVCVLCGNVTGSGTDQGIDNCMTCTRTGSDKPVCNTCKEGYYLDSDGSCKVCTGANCATCSKDDLTKCSTCKPGYFKQGDSPGTCTPCDDADSGIPGCAACTFSSSLTCNSCKANYKASGTGSVTCTKVCEDDSACGGTAGSCGAIVVGGDGNMKYYCSLCGESGKVPIDGKCVDKTSSANGNICDRGVCTSCTANYFLYMGGCYKVDTEPGSLMCSKATTAGVCETPNANSRYFAVPGAKVTDQSVLGCGNPLGVALSDTNAYVGVEDCRTCTAPSETSPTGMAAAKCTACDEGKVLTSSGYGCVTCDIAGCSTCRADNMCETCSDGYRLEGDACVRTGGNLSTGAIAGMSVTKSSYALCY